MTSSSGVGLIVRADAPGATIERNVHGQFVEHLGSGVYGGIWVGEDSAIPNTHGIRADVVEALRRLHVPVIRWPGGCFADRYHWRDGVGRRVARPRRVNASWGGVIETNAFGSHEFMEFAELIGAAPYVNGNVGSGSPQEMAEWVEYLTSDADSELADLRRRNGRHMPWAVPYLGFGNEPWGCGGSMRAAAYADEFRRFATFVGTGLGSTICRIAAGADGEDPGWTETLMAEAGPHLDALTVHHYTLPTGSSKRKGAATGFGEAEWISTMSRCLRIDEVIRNHAAILDRFDPAKRVALIVDEWGTWYDPDPGTDPAALRQQNGIRDALVAAVTLNVLHGHADRVRMANIAQLVNVLQAMILTDGDRVVLTPTYHVFEMYRPFQGATSVPVELEAPGYALGDRTVPSLHASAAIDGRGRRILGVVNLLPFTTAEVSARIAGARVTRATGRVLTADEMDAVNDVERPDAVSPLPLGTALRMRPGGVDLELPPKSVAVVQIE